MVKEAHKRKGSKIKRKEPRLKTRRIARLAQNSAARLEKFMDLDAPEQFIRKETTILLRRAWSLWWRVRFNKKEYVTETEENKGD